MEEVDSTIGDQELETINRRLRMMIQRMIYFIVAFNLYVVAKFLTFTFDWSVPLSGNSLHQDPFYVTGLLILAYFIFVIGILYYRILIFASEQNFQHGDIEKYVPWLAQFSTKTATLLILILILIAFVLFIYGSILTIRLIV